MTLFPTGDKGQRYEISATGYPEQGRTMVIGWTEYPHDAERMAKNFLKAPSCESTQIKDRWGKEEVRTFQRESEQ